MDLPNGDKMMSGKPRNENPLIALILSGGQSTRMGMDKGLLPLSNLKPELLAYCEFPSFQHGKVPLKRLDRENHQHPLSLFSSRSTYLYSGITWTEHLSLVCASTGLPVYISINQDQWESYAAFFYESQLIRDQEIMVSGPLKGLLSAHSQLPEADLLVITCDMPLLHANHLQLLISQYKDLMNEAKNIAFKGESIPWLPFPAIYHHQLLNQATYNSTSNYNSCIKIIANNPKIACYLPGNLEIHFRNFNAKGDFN